MIDETKYVYEVRDTTMEDSYHLLGVFSSIEKAREILESDKPHEAQGAYLEDYCVMSIVEVPLDNLRKYMRVIEEHTYAKGYNEATDEEEWLKTGITVNIRR